MNCNKISIHNAQLVFLKKIINQSKTTKVVIQRVYVVIWKCIKFTADTKSLYV